MRTILNALKALSDPTRLRAWAALRDQELCVCHLIELLELAPSTVSKHMSILKQARLVDARRQGRWTHYRLADEEVPAELVALREWLLPLLAEARQMAADQEKKKRILECAALGTCSSPGNLKCSSGND